MTDRESHVDIAAQLRAQSPNFVKWLEARRRQLGRHRQLSDHETNNQVLKEDNNRDCRQHQSDAGGVAGR